MLRNTNARFSCYIKVAHCKFGGGRYHRERSVKVADLNRKEKQMDVYHSGLDLKHGDFSEDGEWKEMALNEKGPFVEYMRLKGICNVVGVSREPSRSEVKAILQMTLPQVDICVVAPNSKEGKTFLLNVMCSLGRKRAITYVPLSRKEPTRRWFEEKSMLSHHLFAGGD